MRGVRVLVCGSRDWSDPAPIEAVLAGYKRQIAWVIHGGARGADEMAGQIARRIGLRVEEFPADWRGQGKAAGHIRNRLMLDEGKPDVVWAFKDGFDPTLSRGGTENMVRIAQEAGVPTYVVGTGRRQTPGEAFDSFAGAASRLRNVQLPMLDADVMVGAGQREEAGGDG